MNTLTVQLPESLHRNIRELALRDGWSVDQFIVSAAAEKMAALVTLDHLREEAAKGNRREFDAFLSAVPDIPPDQESDRIRTDD
ncbi:hypothetical protein OpiT1DRAFT_00531 [Opitutaceae bacterium TAV1]|nr:CopG family transcriptional regulator [Opitutaceae bacterium TAV5]EIQ01954.1 hypothetical protein OpiT1DRAFT_00531 [Opitutaceae bacterium TAV1]